jgi:hypothetical protein
MRRKTALLLLLQKSFIVSCSFTAGEAASNYLASEGKTIGYVETRTIGDTIAGHGLSLALGIVLNPLAEAWLRHRDALTTRKLALDCLMQRRDNCIEEAAKRVKTIKEYFITLRTGRCTWGINPFNRFNKCYREAFYKLSVNMDQIPLESALFQVYYDSRITSCLPDPADYKENQEELMNEYFLCKSEAMLFATKKLKELTGELNKYQDLRDLLEGEGE